MPGKCEEERRMYREEKLREELSNTLTQVAPLVSTVSLEAEGSMDECLGQILAMAAATQASI